MIRIFCYFTFLLLLPVFSLAALAEDASSKALAPKMASAKIAESGELTILHTELVPEQFTETRKVTVTEFRTEIVGGRQVAKPVEVVREVSVASTRYLAKEIEIRIAKENFHVLGLEGQAIEGEALSKALANGKPVLFTYGKKMIDPFYADFFKPGTLVVYLHEAPPGPPAAAPVPAPIRAEAIPLRGIRLRAVPAIPVPAIPEPAPEAPPE